MARYVGAWISVAVAATVLFWAVAFVVNPNGPACVIGRPGVEPRPVMPLWTAIAGPLVTATALIGLLWASARISVLRRLLALAATAVATVLAFLLGVALTPVCT